MPVLPRWLESAVRFDATQAVLSRKTNMLTFLVVRFLLMSAMVVGFSWAALDLHP